MAFSMDNLTSLDAGSKIAPAIRIQGPERAWKIL